MNIHGFQKMTLLDYPGHVAATVFLGACDYRCPYCHNFELVDGSVPPAITQEELFSFLDKRRGILDGVVITGGEPCLRKELPAIAGHIKDMGFLVKLDTNGNHPDMLRNIINCGLIDYVAMDIKNSIHKYGMTIGLPGFDTSLVEESVRILLQNKVDYEFRTTVVAEFHEENDFELIGEWIRGCSRYYLQQYVYRDTVPDKTLHSPSDKDMDKFLQILKKKNINAYLRGI